MHHAVTPVPAGVVLAVDRALAGAGSAATAVADELVAVVDALDASGSLRRALSDVSGTADDRAALAEHVLGDRVGARALAVVVAVVRHRWRTDRDVTAAVERGAAQAALTAAEADGALGRVAEELFAFDRVLVGSRALRAALSDQRSQVSARLALVDGLLADKVHPTTLRLVRRIVSQPRGRTVSGSLADLGRLAAERQLALVAKATTAVRLTEAQTDRLERTLTKMYGRGVKVNNAIDPTVIGGVQVQVGDETVDSTVIARLDEVRRRLAG